MNYTRTESVPEEFIISARRPDRFRGQADSRIPSRGRREPAHGGAADPRSCLLTRVRAPEPLEKGMGREQMRTLEEAQRPMCGPPAQHFPALSSHSASVPPQLLAFLQSGPSVMNQGGPHHLLLQTACPPRRQPGRGCPGCGRGEGQTSSSAGLPATGPGGSVALHGLK